MAPLALLAWPFVALVLMAQLPRGAAITWAVLIPYLLLPEAYEIELPGLPDLDKQLMISLGLVLGMVLFGDAYRRANPPKDEPKWAHGIYRWILICAVGLMLSGMAITLVTNQEPLFYGPRMLPPVRVWDGVSLLSSLFALLVPAYFGLRHMATPESHKLLLKAVVISALLYTLLMLIEIRLSPQLHNWVYGYHQHSFLQHIRDGYRPKVFLVHGLHVGFFLFTAVVAAVCLWLSERKEAGGHKWIWAALWLGLMLAISRNLGAFMIAILAIGALFVLPRRLQLWGMLFAAGLLIFYPAVRQSQILPLDEFTEAIARISEDRAQSFDFRLHYEDLLLEHAKEKPLGGWGLWGRNRIFDPETGRDITVSDGLWIVVLGKHGWIYYIGFFTLLTGPLWVLGRAMRRKEIGYESLGLAFVLAGNLIYIIPNATLDPLGVLLLGALSGYVYKDLAEKSKTSEEDHGAAQSSRPSYSRFAPRAAEQG